VRFIRKVLPLLFLASFFLQAYDAQALPIGFGKNQGPVKYSEIKSDHFYIYHDARTPEEGAMMLNALEGARVPMERWFQEKRSTPLPVVMSAISENASFANFIADAVELQTLGQGNRELAWHEYVHSTMYRKFDNLIGPAGALIYLPWMPAWFLEGLAEALSVSVGSDVVAGVERYQALNNDWPTYARLHSLYSKEGFAERGYATSGALVSYVLRKGNPNELSKLLEDFYKYSQPWWWPWAVVPFNGFMPMDQTLENYVQVNGRQLYEQYKKDALAHWSKNAEPFHVSNKAEKRAFNSIFGMKSNGQKILHLNREDDVLQEMSVSFNKETGWAESLSKERAISADYASFSRVNNEDIQAGVRYEEKHSGEISYISVQFLKHKNKAAIIKRNAIVSGLTSSETRLYWTEFIQSKTRVCSSTFTEMPKVVCHMEVKNPVKVRFMGERYAGGALKELWISQSTEKLAGTFTEVHVLDTTKNILRKSVFKTEIGLLSAAFAGDDVWLLTAERNGRVVRKMSKDFVCTGVLPLSDHVMSALGLNDGSLVLGLYAGSSLYVKKFAAKELTVKPCTPYLPTSSPIQYAVKIDPQSDLKTAFVKSDFWNSEPTGAPIAAQADLEKLAAAKPLNEDMQPATGSETSSSPSKWRQRPLFLFPWIGADDALGSQIGIVTVPLMDHLQNETVRATLLYGTASRFPYQDVSVTSTRFLPTITLTAFRQQTYNGRFIRRVTEEIVNGYYDEKGVRLESEYGFKTLGGTASLGTGIKYSHLKPYLGPTTIRKGLLAEPVADLSLFHSFGRFGLNSSISGRVAPESLNEEFDYNQVGASTNLSLSTGLLASKFSLGVEGSRTRGKKMRELKEVYRPLKTYIPGSGGGFNQNSFPITGDGSGLFSPVFGDTQARAKANWTFPIIREFDKLLWILYLERLDFTAFFNYGGAWTGPEPRRGWDKLIRAHGYTVDLQLENKGVRFNLGLGAGQVLGKDPELYLTTGFDALF
jgi:hypothetical protein